MNEISDSFAVLCTRLEERVGRLEDLNNKAPTSEKPQYRGSPLCVGREAILQLCVFDREYMLRKITKEVEDFNLRNITEIQGEDNMIIPKIGSIMVEQYHPADSVEDLIVTTECKNNEWKPRV